MKDNVMLTVASLLSILLMTFHLTDDIVRGMESGGNFAKSSGAFFFIWTLIALGVTALFSVILSVRGLWSRRSGQPR